MPYAKDTLQAILDNLPAVLFIKDRHGRYLLASRSLEQGWNLPPQSLLGNTDAFLFPGHPEVVDDLRRSDQLVILGGKPVQKEETVYRDGLKLDFLTIKFPLAVGGEAVVGGIATNITELKRAQAVIRENEARLIQLTQDLQLANRDLQQFAAIASHDLKEPLRTIFSYLRLIEQQLGPTVDSDTAQFIEITIAGARRMSRMIDGLLGYSKAGVNRATFRTGDLNETVSEALAALQAELEERKAMVTVKPLPREVFGDHTLLGEVIQNLLTNALKFQPCGSTPQVEIGAESADSYTLVYVRDNGIGIPPEDRDRIFHMFQRIHNQSEYSGTGIGLAVSKRIVEGHGGKIWLESKPGGGTTFYFTLPLSETGSAPGQTAPKSAPETRERVVA